MKILPKQSVCPYCGTVYRYGDLKRLVWKKKQNCYHCKKIFNIMRSGFLFLAVELLAVYAIMNSIAIGIMGTVTFWALFVMNVIPATAAVILLPMYTDFRKKDKKDKKKNQ